MATKCPLCEDTGWKSSSVDSKVRTVVRCDCHFAARNARLLEQAGIPAQYEHCTFDGFDLGVPGATKSLANAVFFARRFVEQYPVEKGGVLLSGSCGTGKTHLAVGMLKELVQRKGVRGLFCAYTGLLKQIQATYQNQFADEETGEALTEHSILQDVIQAEVLLLDDLGAVRSTEWSLSTLYHLINERYNHRRTTVITTNVPWEVSSSKPPEKQSEEAIQAREAMRVEALRDRISERTYSRIAEMCPHRIELEGVDYRRVRGAR